jgi:hypothetical protein
VDALSASNPSFGANTDANVNTGINDKVKSNRIDAIRYGDDCVISLINDSDENIGGNISNARC